MKQMKYIDALREGLREEMLRDDDCDVEVECLASFGCEEVRAAVARLGEDEQKLIKYLYLSIRQGTERGYSIETGTPQKTINDRKKRALAMLMKILTEKP